VPRDVENLPLDIARHTVMLSSDGVGTVMMGGYVDYLDHRPPRANLPFVDEAEPNVINMADDGASSLHRNDVVVLTNTRTAPKLQLLPPMAFMSRADGTPISITETGRGHVSMYGEREKQAEKDGDVCEAEILKGRTRDEKDTVGGFEGQSENVADHTAELLHIRQTLRAFADHKSKLKFVQFLL